MALDDPQIIVQSFNAAKDLVKRGNPSADNKTKLEAFPQEIFDHSDSPVRK